MNGKSKQKNVKAAARKELHLDMPTKILYMLFCFFYIPNLLVGQELSHPRIYVNDEHKEFFKERVDKFAWKQQYVQKKIKSVDKFIEYHQNDPTWLLSRLQMNWKTKHDKVFLNGGDFSHSSGEASVPTVRFSGTRDWATEYLRPKLEDVKPYFDDPKGFYLEHKNTGKMEWVSPSETGHMIEKVNEQIMSIAADAAFLYWLTDEQKYAEMAAPVFLTYMEGMYHRDAPIDIEKKGNQQHISGLATFEVIHEGIIVPLTTIYDFLYGYFEENGNDLQNSIAVFQKWGDQIIEKGIPDNNWNLFQARFLTYIALILDADDKYSNGKGRQYFLDRTFTTTTDRQLSISESLLEYDPNTAIWPESASYSTHVITTLLRIMTLLDHSTNNNELAKYNIIEKAALASFQYLFPSGYTIGFGDSNHKPLPPENFELLIANYQKYNEQNKEELMSQLLNEMIRDDLYEREASNLFQLFFYVDELKVKVGTEGRNLLDELVTPTFYASNVSLFNQRMGSGSEALMASLVGSYGNHAHANGISLELFANNYALGPDMGRGPSYWHNTHRAFYSRFPAHNTVIVERSSDYSAMRSKHPFTLEHSFPVSGETSIFEKITFAQVSFLEPKTVSDQKRFTALIKSHLPSGRGYVLDVFRSKKQSGEDQLHEYVYHNIGQTLEFSDEAEDPLNFFPTEELSSRNGALKGYDFFTGQQKVVTPNDVRALFTVEGDNLMKVWIKGSKDQTIFSVKSPKSNAISKGTAPENLLDEPLPTIIISREGEAWENPFSLVFNPFFEQGENPIKNVSYSSMAAYPNTQIIEVRLGDQKTIDKMVLNVSENDIASDSKRYQKGLFSLTRSAESDDQVTFLFLSGMKSYKSAGWEVSASGETFTAAFEKKKGGYQISTDQAIKVSFAHSTDLELPEISCFLNGKIVQSRKVRRSRHDENKVIFNIDRAYEKVELSIPNEIGK